MTKLWQVSSTSWVFCNQSSSLNSPVCFLSQAPYVKVYLLDNGVCIAKKKTKVARKTLEPLYQQLLSFEESPQGKVLQVFIELYIPYLRRCLHGVKHSLPVLSPAEILGELPSSGQCYKAVHTRELC